jgi:hypothetical protein
MLTGRRPFNPETQFQLAEMQRKGVRIKPTDLRPGLPATIDVVVLKALSYEPERRYLSSRSLGDALADALMESKVPGSSQVSSQADTQTMEAIPTVRIIRTKSRLIPAAALLLLVGAIGVMVWQRITSHPTTDKPAGNVGKSADSSSGTNRTIDYYLMVQKYLPNGKPYQSPFKATGNDILGDGWHFRVHISSPQNGYLYLVNEGPAAGGAVTYNLLFPTPRLNSGSAQLESGQDLEAGPYGLDTHQGTERFWLVWSAAPVPELDAVKDVVNSRDKGTISDPQHERAIRTFLETHSKVRPDVQTDRINKLVHVKANSDVLVYLLELEHH